MIRRPVEALQAHRRMLRPATRDHPHRHAHGSRTYLATRERSSRGPMSPLQIHRNRPRQLYKANLVRRPQTESFLSDLLSLWIPHQRRQAGQIGKKAAISRTPRKRDGNRRTYPMAPNLLVLRRSHGAATTTLRHLQGMTRKKEGAADRVRCLNPHKAHAARDKGSGP